MIRIPVGSIYTGLLSQKPYRPTGLDEYNSTSTCSWSLLALSSFIQLINIASIIPTEYIANPLKSWGNEGDVLEVK